MPESGLAVRGDGAPAAGTADSRAAGGARVDRRWRRVLRNGRLVLGGTVVTVFLVLTLLAPWIAPRDPLARDLQNTLKPPSREFLLGTDELGRDLLSRLLHGARITLGISVVALLVSAMVGLALGTSAGYVRAAWDHVAMRLIDIQLSFPGIILAIAVIAVMGRGLTGLAVALSIFPIPAFARLARAATMVENEQEYVLAARGLGVPHRLILLRHILPNIMGPILVQASLSIASIILVGSSLGFLGLGAQPPEPEWGLILSRGRSYVYSAPHMMTYPGLAVAAVVFGFTLLGDGLRDHLDPRLRGQLS
ncbi:MAG: ABC transporter permease [Candidatus Rokubacteria bacterium]|jgi:ABC-type dipeptide/oligopeptide/nickel transport system permease subunit|nr:ABC transporter permease [Candidatus Rokubacteria bacterium]